jgi:UDP-2,4-diacetamido-2,4,6-trideoxy-beta-L-altropyranose hydrolase
VLVCIRTDASLEIGSGHVMRCLTLAAALRARGARVQFLCRDLPGNLCGLIESRQFSVLRLAANRHARSQASPDMEWEDDAAQSVALLSGLAPVNWLVVDHYGLDARWENALRASVDRIMVIDDLANRAHHCDLLLDQNYYVDPALRYPDLLAPGCRQLLGPTYALLRPEFGAARAARGARDGQVRRLMVFFGASDLGNDTMKAVLAIRQAAPALLLDVVVGVNNPHRKAIHAATAQMAGARCHEHADMAALMSAADLYVGAAGTTTWERCCMGLPSLVITVAANQEQAVAALDSLGVLKSLGASGRVSQDALAMAIADALASPGQLAESGRRAMALVDGQGTLRCSDALLLWSGEAGR